MQGILSSASEDDVEEQDYVLDGTFNNAQDLIDGDQSNNIYSDSDSDSRTFSNIDIFDDYLYFEDEELDFEGLQERLEFDDGEEFYNARKLGFVP